MVLTLMSEGRDSEVELTSSFLPDCRCSQEGQKEWPSQHVFSTPVEMLKGKESSFKPLEFWISLRSKINELSNHEYIMCLYGVLMCLNLLNGGGDGL